MQKEQFIVVNTTVKQPRIDPVTKRDLRPIEEKRGFNISFTDEKGKSITLPPGRPAVVSELDSGLYRLEKSGYVSIKRFSGVPNELRDHVMKRDTGFNKENVIQGRTASAVEMGHVDQSAKDALLNHEYEGAKNPDGNPNFRVIAERNPKKRQRKAKQQELVGESTSGII